MVDLFEYYDDICNRKRDDWKRGGDWKYIK